MLRREVGIFGATMMGLGAMVGTGIFVSIGNAAGSAGPAVILAVAVAAMIAAFNGLSSAQLAAAHPVSGGTYEYGYRLLHPSLGFTAGWMFVCAKSASAATAALGFAGYVLNVFGQHDSVWRILLALLAVTVFTVLVSFGIRRSSNINSIVVSITLLALLVFIVVGIPTAVRHATENMTPFFDSSKSESNPIAALLEAIALMFVAYTGYGRIATLGEEIRDPQRNIPISIIATLLVSMVLYVSVGFIAIATVGSDTLARATQQQAAPLEVVAQHFDAPAARIVVAVGAITSMLGVLLNLILGISRVVLAMGRRGDLPSVFARLDTSGTTPYAAVFGVGVVVAILVFTGNVKTTWSFSAFTVLIYYAITNLSAIRLPENRRLYYRSIPWLGLFSCLFLAFWVERSIWMIGLGLIAVGLVWWSIASRLSGRSKIEQSTPAAIQ
jgi:APA family basic amino acid/polyamine antiporter